MLPRAQQGSTGRPLRVSVAIMGGVGRRQDLVQGSSAAALVVCVGLLVGSALSGCRATPRDDATAATDASRGYFVRGEIEGTDAKAGTVVLKHEAVAGLMPAMTMEYRLANPTELSELHRGDRITATILADKSADGPTNLRLTNLDVIAEARPDYLPPVQYHVPALGDQVPDFKLLNQSDHKINLRQFRGKVVAMTFVYTRCPLADFCPRMSRNFAQMDQALAADPELYARTHLLTVSFDPSYDTPKVLRSYGGAYTGRYTQERFAHWDFAAPSVAELPTMEQWFDVGVTPAGQGSLQHSLTTVIFDGQGKVLAFYPTNTWTVDEALKVMRGAAG